MSENTQTVVERAWQEAERRYPSRRGVITSVGTDAERNYLRTTFRAGATFAATITPEQIEAGARALRDGDDAYPDTYGDEDYREMVRATVRAMGFEVSDD